MIRRMTELLSRNVVLRRSLPAEFGGGKIYVSPGARLSYWNANIFEQEKFLFDSSKLLISKGDTVWDIGANAGVFSAAAAATAGETGRVIAVEADYWLVSLLHRTSKSLQASYAPIDVVNLAVADQLGFAEFAIAARGRAANFLVKAGGSSQAGGMRTSYRMMTIGLDQMLEMGGAPRVVKIDIEGAEILAMRGARRLLSEIRPRILCEVGDDNHAEFSRLLHQASYVLFDAENLPRRIETSVLNTLRYPVKTHLSTNSRRRRKQWAAKF